MNILASALKKYFTHAMKKIGVVAIALGVCGVSVAYAATTPPLAQPITIQVTNAKASTLLLEIARLEKLDMVVANRAFAVRLTIAEKFASPRMAIDNIVARAQLKISQKNGVMMIADPCTAELPAPLAAKSLNPFSDARLSVNFLETDLATLLSLLQLAATQSDANIDTNSNTNTASFSTATALAVGVHLQNQSARQIYEMLASATGTRLMATTTEEFLVSQLATQKKGCKPISAAIDIIEPTYSAPASVTNPLAPGVSCARIAMYPATANIDCQPLESYKFTDITVRGFLKKNDALITLAETHDQLSWPIGKDDLLGENFAKVETVSEKGLVIKELFINRYGYPFDRKFLLGFDGKQSAVPD